MKVKMIVPYVALAVLLGCFLVGAITSKIEASYAGVPDLTLDPDEMMDDLRKLTYESATASNGESYRIARFYVPRLRTYLLIREYRGEYEVRRVDPVNGDFACRFSYGARPKIINTFDTGLPLTPEALKDLFSLKQAIKELVLDRR